MFIKHLRLNSLIIMITLIAHHSQALPFIDADGFVAGDKKAIYETSTGLTWLDFGVTQNKSYNQVIAELDSTYFGWRLPTESEVKNLWNNTINTQTRPPFSDYNHEYIENSNAQFYYKDIFGLWGANVIEINQLKSDNLFKLFFYYSSGMLLSDEGNLIAISIWEDSALLNYLQPNENWIHDVFAGTTEINPLDPNAISIYSSTLLVKDASVIKTPEPTPISILFCGLIILATKRYLGLKNRRKQKK